MSKKDWVEQQVKSNKVVIFSKTYCPHCTTAKDIFSSVGVKDYVLFELDKMADGDEIFDVLLKMTRARTVPRVFIGGTFVGGCSDVERLKKSGQLVQKLKTAGAL